MSSPGVSALRSHCTVPGIFSLGSHNSFFNVQQTLSIWCVAGTGQGYGFVANGSYNSCAHKTQSLHLPIIPRNSILPFCYPLLLIDAMVNLGSSSSSGLHRSSTRHNVCTMSLRWSYPLQCSIKGLFVSVSSKIPSGALVTSSQASWHTPRPAGFPLSGCQSFLPQPLPSPPTPFYL